MLGSLRDWLSLSAVAVLAASVALPATAQERVRWKMQSAFGSQLPHLGPSGVRFTEDIKRMSGGKFDIKFHEPGALVPPLECFDAVSKGSIESCWTTPGYHTGKYPALAFFTTVPFGPGIGEFLAWKWFGGGNKLRDEIYAKHGLKAFDCFCIGPETSGWFRREIKDAEDMKGIKMRFFGLGARVMQKLGVSTQLLAAADIFPSLERGVIDATEFSMPMMDMQMGFHQIAKYNYFPGWHQQSSCSEFLMNAKAFDALPDAYKAMIEVSAKAQVIYTFAETEAMQFPLMAEMTSKHGVKIMRWSDKDLATYEKVWLEVIAEDSAKDPLFKKVADSYLDFRKRYAVWGGAQFMKPTYLDK
ncbi:MAG: C4-dicarboxylate ABC transporter [Alphaproteobacteria bacterium RIFCSPHIGHO2_12_FULL_66_14]|jgi:TRAP-type mannitol/chloroaromatic compound transport system substrate-binding protein|nr:MAG: C4-dicarboxylate ABC transporter [Alphaproteobacteria bacterium RIFCSPHIGHO2_12_FULL_66_14]